MWRGRGKTWRNGGTGKMWRSLCIGWREESQVWKSGRRVEVKCGGMEVRYRGDEV